MKLLFDQNVSHHLVTQLADQFPESAHVRALGLSRADDETVWRHAATEGFTLVSKDSDFHQRALTFGPPPKVIWLRLGNASTSAIAALLRERSEEIRSFIENPEAAFLALS